MPESLGEKLRQAREERGISISEVAEQTRISPLYLESIENDDYRTLPGGIFNKGFVKSFAAYVGVDEDEALQDYARIASTQETSSEDKSSRSYRPEVLTDDSSGPSMLPTVILAVIILGLMTWGILALVNYLKDSQSQTVENNIANNNVKVTDEDANANVNTAANQNAVQMDSIKVKVTTTASELAITATVDGKREIRMLNSEVPEQVFEADENLKLSYFRGLAETARLNVNGKDIETPLPPPNYRRNGFEYEINMNNLKQILQTGKIVLGATQAPANSNTNAKPATNANPPAQAQPNANAVAPRAANSNANTANTSVPPGPPAVNANAAPR